MPFFKIWGVRAQQERPELEYPHKQNFHNCKQNTMFLKRNNKKVYRKAQRVPQSQTAANPRHQEEEKNDKN